MNPFGLYTLLELLATIAALAVLGALALGVRGG